MPAPVDTARFHMADVRRKRPTDRRAVATGEFDPGTAWEDVVERRLPKGDALVMAEIAGLQGAKGAAQLMPLCHPLPLELVRVQCEPDAGARVIRVYAEVATHARTGVEMEALAAVSAALLTLYDLTKPVQPALSFGKVRLLFKEGGKKGLWLHPDGMSEAERERFRPRGPKRLDGVRTAAITVSDRASAGAAEDRSGPLLAERLRALGAEVAATETLPDGIEPLASRLRGLAAAGMRLAICSGGTGAGPRDDTRQALLAAADREAPGIGEMLRSESSAHTPLAWLGNTTAIVTGGMLVIALPGSPRAVAECMDILAPVLGHALDMVAGSCHAP